ncbi:MAG: pilus assembly protein PilM [Opitutales bacterium]|nr:pilus assembly protein PilM [Opitutales bacterium]
MAKVSAKTIINCGTTHVTGSVFSEKNGALYLEQFITEPLSYDYSDENSWESEIARAMRVIAKQIKSEGNVALVVPGQFLITKEARIATVTDESRRRKIYAEEAAAQFQRLIPLDELVWDAQSVNRDEIEEELIFFAMKLEKANRLIEQARLAGLKPTHIQPNTILDIQAYRYLERLNGTLNETVLVLNVGAKTSNLTYVSPTGYSVNNINVGGNFVTQTIAEAQGIDFEKAERLKLEVFSVYNETGAFPATDVGGVVAAACDKFVRRLSKEITLRLVVLRKRGDKPTRILASGRGRLAPGFFQSLSTLQKVPVERLSVTDYVEIAPYIPEGEIKENSAQLQEAIGAAAILVVPEIPTVNLFPQELVKIAAFKKQIPWYVLGGMMIAVAPWLVFMKAEEQAVAMVKDIQEQQKAINSLNERKIRVQNLQKGIDACNDYVVSVDRILDNRYNWNEVLEELQKTQLELASLASKTTDGELVPASDRHIWIESMEVKRNYVPAKDADGDKPAVPAKVNSDLIVTFKLLIPEIDGMNPSHNAKIFNARLKMLREVLARNMHSAEPGGISDSANLNPANLPTITFTIRLKDKEGI